MADDSKTEKATPKKRKDERKKGNVFVSKDIVGATGLLVIFLFIKAIFPFIYKKLNEVILKYMGMASIKNEITDTFAMEVYRDFVTNFMLIVMPILLISVLVAIISTGAQTRFLFAKDNLKFKFSRLNPLSGLKRMFSMRSLVELIKGLLKISVIGYVLYKFILDKVTYFHKLHQMDLMQDIQFLLNSVIDLVLNAIGVFFVIACIDLFYQWWEYERNIRMSKEEIKQEYKQLEGDPQIKSKIKQKQRMMASSRMMQEVPNADVIIRNPTHFAVALKYDMDKYLAPIVVAKGQDELALRIIDVGQQNNVYIMENRELARALYRTVDIGGAVPPDYYGVIAEILALVYSIKKKEN